MLSSGNSTGYLVEMEGSSNTKSSVLTMQSFKYVLGCEVLPKRLTVQNAPMHNGTALN